MSCLYIVYIVIVSHKPRIRAIVYNDEADVTDRSEILGTYVKFNV